jgi:hypothetical protein
MKYIICIFANSRQGAVMHIRIGHETKTSLYDLARFIMTLETETWVNLWKEIRKDFADLR